MPPPNVTGALHLGHAINNTLQDILIRNHRMRGFNTLWVPGIDHAGIATQAVVEKQLKEKENKTRNDIGREALVKKIWEWKAQYGDRILEQLRRLGSSCDWSRTRFTLDDTCARAVRETFFKLFKDGLIYRGKRLVNWDVQLQTSISDDEIYHETVKTNLWHIRYPIEGSDRTMTIATTRPETMLGDTAVAVHSQDPRWNWAIGKTVRLPLVDRLIPIIADDILVDPKFGTGVVKVTPAHDPNDYAVWQRHLSAPDKIEIINILNPDGSINTSGGPYANMKRAAARAKVVEDLTAAGLMEKIEPYETQVGHSDRSKTPIEPMLSDQWFVKMADLAEKAIQAAKDGRVKFHPERHAQQYLSWLGEKRDWPISRQLWWGHRIPVWVGPYMTMQLPDTLDDSIQMDNLTPWMSEKVRQVTANQLLPDQITNKQKLAICVLPGFPDVESELEQHGFVQDPDVLDTWFSSALWPHSTLGWPDKTPDLARYYPTSALVTSREILTLWVARMVITGLYNMNDVPFSDVVIHATILDGHGQRMSKSAGNGVDPIDVIDTHGADALRFTLAMMATETQDVRLPVKKLADGRNTSEKFDLGRNFCNKLWNASRFVMGSIAGIPHADKPIDLAKCSDDDRWILSRLARTIDEANKLLESFRFDAYARACYEFFWNDLCDWYIENVNRESKIADPTRDEQRHISARILAAAIDASLRLLHPIIPFITESIWQTLAQIRPTRALPGLYEPRTESLLISSQWPLISASVINPEIEAGIAILQEGISTSRNLRNENKIDLKKKVEQYISPAPDLIGLFERNLRLINNMTGGTTTVMSPLAIQSIAGPRSTFRGCELVMSITIDEAADQKRTGKQRDDLTKQIVTLRSRLGNESYIAKAPPALVKQTQDQLAAAEAELAKLG
jgi:valyl-tRNA synthetase